MKNLYIILTLSLITLSASSQTYYIHTAKNSGNWSNSSNWLNVARADSKKVTEYIIPKNITISLDINTNLVSIGDVEMTIAGTFEIQSDKILSLTNDSKITLTGGVIDMDDISKKEKEDKKNKKKEQIIIGGEIKYDAALEDAVTGNMFASKATGRSPLGFYANSVLPVNFVSFNASKLNDAVVAINWSTSDEINNSHFEIQRSLDGINWSSIATVFPAEDAGSVHLYKYNDKFSVKGNTYYRIRQVDIDGKEKYTSVRVIGGVKSELETFIYVSAKSTVTVELKKSTNSSVTVRLVNMNGVIVNQKANNQAGEKISLLAYNAAPGAYVVQVIAANGAYSTKKIIL